MRIRCITGAPGLFSWAVSGQSKDDMASRLPVGGFSAQATWSEVVNIAVFDF